MTQDEKDLTLGQARRQYRETKQELAALKLRARQIGEHFRVLSELLTTEPQNVIFQGQEYATPFAPAKDVTFRDGEFTAFTPESLRALTAEIRQTMLRLQTLRDSLQEMGED